MTHAQRLTAAIAAVALVFAGALGAVLLTGGDGSSSVPPVQAGSPIQDRGIKVEGEGQINVEPDVARLTLGIELEGPELDDLRDDADTRMNNVVDALQEMGIDEADIQTVTYDIRVQEQRSERVDARVTEEPAVEVEEETATSEEDENGTEPDETIYQLIQLVQVRITDIDMAGEVIETALDAGANRVGSISFEIENRADAVEQARELAVDEARAKAEHLAELTGVSLGAPLQIEEWSPSGPPVRMEEVEFAMDMADDAPSPRIEPGQQTISVQVSIRYGIE